MSSGGYLSAASSEPRSEFMQEMEARQIVARALPEKTLKQAKKKRAALQRIVDLFETRAEMLRTLIAITKRLPEGHMERDEFFDNATGPGMPDELSATLRRNPDQPDERAFSIEGFEAIGYQMHDFVMARTLAFMDREGRAPKAVRAEISLVWDDDKTDEEMEATEWSPWYAVTDSGTKMLTVDGEHRLSVFLTERRRGDA